MNPPGVQRAVRPLEIEGVSEFGTIFPPNDPVARFVLAMGMAQNDIRFAALDAVAKNEEGHPRTRYMSRIAIAHTYEAVYALRRWRSEYPEVRKFLDRLPKGAKDDLKAASSVVEGIGGEALEHSRNRTFHYPYPDQKRNPDSDEELVEILERMSDEPAEFTITRSPERHQEYELKFADDVALMATFNRHDPAMLKDQYIAAKAAGGAFSGFVDDVLNLYMEDRRIIAGKPKTLDAESR